MEVPLGFRFCPTDQELISGYLLKKIRGEELPWNGILEFDLYGEKAPWEIFGDLLNEEEEKLYVFTRQKKASKNRIARAAGCGTWHESYYEKIYENWSANIIGLRKLFCFKVKEGTCWKKTNWLMHEFSLFGEQEKTIDLVLCVIQRKGNKTRNEVNRNSPNQVHVGQELITVTASETPYQEAQETLVDTNTLPPKDRTRQRKRMRGDMELDGPQASKMPREFSCPCMMEESAPKSSPQGNAHTTELQIHMGSPLSCDTSFSDFYDPYFYLPSSPSAEEWREWFVNDAKI